MTVNYFDDSKLNINVKEISSGPKLRPVASKKLD